MMRHKRWDIEYLFVSDIGGGRYSLEWNGKLKEDRYFPNLYIEQIYSTTSYPILMALSIASWTK